MSRRFFSGRTVQAAVLAAAAHYDMEPGELAYEEIDKRHGFLKNRSKVVIAVDPESPRRPAPAPAPAREEAAPRRAASRPAPAPEREPEDERAEAAPEPGTAAESEADEPAGAVDPEDEPVRAAEPDADDDADDDAEVGSARDAAEGDGGAAAPRRPRRRSRGRGRGERAGARDGDERPDERAATRAGEDEREQPQRRGKPEERPRDAASSDRDDRADDRGGDLMELPDRPRALRDRYQPAEGAIAEAAEQAVASIAAVAGLEIEATVLQGDDRLEIDLAGPHRDLLVAEDGELLVAIEHLLPRVMRGYGGETAAVRVDCENFQEIREERLRSYAQQIADDVRRSGRARSLDPLSPGDRRIVHLTVADEPGVESESEGNGYLKRVRISPA